MTREQFLRDVAKHDVRKRYVNGLYRHLICTKGSSDQQFEIITWPGHLCFCGDMGSWVFSRLPDMFEIFRGKEINPDYWAEKIQAEDRTGTREFSAEYFAEQVRARLDEWNLGEQDRKHILEALDEEVFHQDYPRDALRRFSWSLPYEVVAFDEVPDGLIWTERYLWCCYAIQWAISRYDEEVPA